MSLPSLSTAALVAAATGIASHLGYFIRGEHHQYGLYYMLASIFSPIIVFLGLYLRTSNVPTIVLATFTGMTTASYFAGLFTSMLIYRAFFHPLRNFPGPTSYKFSKFFHAFSIASKLQNHLTVEELRKQYGDFVRIGPNELAVFNPEGLQMIAGTGSKLKKAPWYDAISDEFPGLNTTRDHLQHTKRRRIWDRGFSAKALRDYESRVTKYADLLMDQIKSFSGKPLNVSLWLNYYSFDVMGDLAFGQSFDMLKNGERHYAMKLLAGFLRPVGLLTPLPWSLILANKIPGLSKGLVEFKAFGDGQVDARKEREPEKPDIMTWLIDAEKNSNDPIGGDKRWLTGDARLIIIAGSDTTAGALTFTMYHLAKDPSLVAKLREELKSLDYTPGSENEVIKIQDGDFLNGMINETLRLYPGVPSGLLRVTPPQGMTINGTYIPGGVTVSSPLHSMGRLESCFPHPLEFIPERWYSKPELIKNKNAFAPFGGGAYSCVGKHLGLMELRGVLARIVTLFDVGFAPGEDGTDLFAKTRDVFTLDLGPLYLEFTPRKS